MCHFGTGKIRRLGNCRAGRILSAYAIQWSNWEKKQSCVKYSCEHINICESLVLDICICFRTFVSPYHFSNSFEVISSIRKVLFVRKFDLTPGDQLLTWLEPVVLHAHVNLSPVLEREMSTLSYGGWFFPSSYGIQIRGLIVGRFPKCARAPLLCSPVHLFCLVSKFSAYTCQKIDWLID